MQVYGFLEKAQLENASADLANALAGLVWFNTSDNKFRYRDNGAIRSVVNEDQAQVLTNKTLTGNIAANLSPDGVETISLPVKSGTFLLNEDIFSFLDASHQVTPSAPGAGNLRIYAKDDNNLYKQDSEGNEVKIGTGGGGLDIYHTEDFEVNNAADMDSGNSVSFLGGGVLAGSLSDLTGGLQFAGNRSLRYTQATGSLNDYFAGPVFDVPVKARGNKSGVKLFYSYTGSDSDIKPEVYDVTNGASLVLETVRVKSFSNPKVFEVYVDVPLTCTQMRWGFQVKAVNDGAVLTVDDIQFNADALAPGEYFASSEWSSYPLSVGGMPNAVGFVEYARQGSVIKVRGYYDSSTGIDGNLWSIGLPAGLSLRDMGNTTYRTPQGRMIEDRNTNANLFFLATEGDDSVKVGYTDGSGAVNPVVERAANFIGQINTNYTFYFEAPIEQWSEVERGVSVRGFDTNDIANQNEFPIQISSIGTLVYDPFGIVSSVVRNSSGNYTINFNSGVFSSDPMVTLTPINSGRNFDARTVSPSSFNALFQDPTGATNLDVDFTAKISRGNDAVKDSERKVILPSGLQNPVAYLYDKKGAVDGGSSISGIQTRELNTIEGDDSFLALSSNQVTLQPGQYDISAKASCYQVNGTKLRLYSVTDASYLLEGLNAQSGSSDTVSSEPELRGRIEITEEKTIELRHYTASARAGAGLGFNVGSGDNIFAQLIITKRA